jgi:hypothetical protein
MAKVTFTNSPHDNPTLITESIDGDSKGLKKWCVAGKEHLLGTCRAK